MDNLSWPVSNSDIDYFASSAPTQESMLPLRTHALSATADPFAPPNPLTVGQPTSPRSRYATSNHEQFVQPQISAPNVQSSTMATLSNNDQTSSDLQIQDGKTPNVYINGLPPNFLEEQLLEMTREFGTVVSVRTFTRHVSDKPS